MPCVLNKVVIICIDRVLSSSYPGFPKCHLLLWVPSKIRTSFWTNIYTRSHNLWQFHGCQCTQDLYIGPPLNVYRGLIELTPINLGLRMLLIDIWLWPIKIGFLKLYGWVATLLFPILLGQNLFWVFSFHLFVIFLLELSCLLVGTMPTLYSSFVVLAASYNWRTIICVMNLSLTSPIFELSCEFCHRFSVTSNCTSKLKWYLCQCSLKTVFATFPVLEILSLLLIPCGVVWEENSCYCFVPLYFSL